MAAARVFGNGPAAAAARQALAALAGEVLVVVPPGGITDPALAMTAIYSHAVTLAESLLADLAPPDLDADGEIRAPAALVLVVNRAALHADATNRAEMVATAALLSWMRTETLRLGSRLRLNALALDLAAPGELSAVLRWMAGAHALAGQVIGDARPKGKTTTGCGTADSRLDPTSAVDLSTSGFVITNR